MYLKFFIEVLKSIFNNKKRVVFPIISVAWGIFLIVLLLSLGNGIIQFSKDKIMNVVENSLVIIPSFTTINYKGYSSGSPIKLKSKSVMDLKNRFADINLISPILFKKDFVEYKNLFTTRAVYGVSPDFSQLRKLSVLGDGRFINPIDIKERERVVVIGALLKEYLFKNEEAVGRTINIGGVNFIVIGLVKAPIKAADHDYDKLALIPYTTYIECWGNQDVSFLMLQPGKKVDSFRLEKNIRSYLANKYHFLEVDKGALFIFNTATVFYSVKNFFSLFQLFLGVCGIFSLAIGSLNVANVMFLIVNERMKEIGLRMALGAQVWHVFLQFFLEAFFLIIIGGIVGFIVSLGSISLLQNMTLPFWLGKPFISSFLIITIIIILAIFCFLASYFPARRAVKLNPIEALSNN